MNAVEQEISKADFQRVAKAVYEHCGINLGDSKQELVQARLAKRLRATNCRTYAEYLDRVLKDREGDEFTTFIDSLSTNLTSFFRENQHFDYLRTTFLPNMAQKGERKQIRAWSAACSTGEEPYTLAITLMETLPNPQSWDIKILATDISTRVLAKATAGIYEADRLKTVAPAIKAKYFEPRRLPDGENAYAVSPELRSRIAFRHLNLMEPFPFTGPMDFIFCRNVMIYFDKPTQEKLVNRLYQLLRPGGLLITGHSESLTGVKHPFEFVQATIYRRS